MNAIRQFINWLFKADPKQDSPSDNEVIEMSVWQIIIISLLIIGILLGIFFNGIKSHFNDSVIIISSFLDREVEKDYFAQNPTVCVPFFYKWSKYVWDAR